MKYVGVVLLISLLICHSEYSLGQTSFFLAAAGPEYSAGVRPLYYYDRILDERRSGANTSKLKLDSYKSGRVKAYLGVADYSEGKGSRVQKRWPKVSEFLQALQRNPFLKSSLSKLFGKNPGEFFESLKPDDRIIVFAELSLLRPLIVGLNSSAFQVVEGQKKRKPAAKSRKTVGAQRIKSYVSR